MQKSPHTRSIKLFERSVQDEDGIFSIWRADAAKTVDRPILLLFNTVARQNRRFSFYDFRFRINSGMTNSLIKGLFWLFVLVRNVQV